MSVYSGVLCVVGSTNVVVCMFMVGSRRRRESRVCVAWCSKGVVAIRLLLLVCKMWYE